MANYYMVGGYTGLATKTYSPGPFIVLQTWKLKTHTKLQQIQVYQEPTAGKAT